MTFSYVMSQVLPPIQKQVVKRAHPHIQTFAETLTRKTRYMLLWPIEGLLPISRSIEGVEVTLSQGLPLLSFSGLHWHTQKQKSGENREGLWLWITSGGCEPIDAFTIEVWWNFDKMQIIFKAVTGSSGHAPWWEGKCGTVRARNKSVAKTTKVVTALGSSLC